MKPVTRKEWREFNRATKCHHCFKEFTHRNCNLRYKIPHHIPIVFHNLSGYDAHLFIRELVEKFDTGKIGAIAENKEKHNIFTIGVVVDTYEELGEVKKRKSNLDLSIALD